MRKLSQLILLSALAPLIPAALAQEQSPAEPRLIEVGARTFWGDVYGRPDLPFDPSLRFSKFNEYRDIRNGLFIRRADS